MRGFDCPDSKKVSVAVNYGGMRPYKSQQMTEQQSLLVSYLSVMTGEFFSHDGRNLLNMTKPCEFETHANDGYCEHGSFQFQLIVLLGIFNY